jgi:pyrroline-5-carboxylate reductase
MMPEEVVVSDISRDVLNGLEAGFPGVRIAHNDNRAAASQDLVFLALHPPALAACLAEIKPCLVPGAILISLAPKIPIAKLTESLGGFNRVVRVIPNAPSIIGHGFNPITFSEAMGGKEKAEILALLGPLGKTPEVAEEKLEAYAVLTGMGPTYFWFQLHELQVIAESFGLMRQEAQTGVAEMVSGAGRTLFGSGLKPEEVMDLVPVKPLGEDEGTIKSVYHARLEGLYRKLKS